MGFLTDQIRSWFSKAKAEVTETTNSFNPLPGAIAAQLAQRIQALPGHPAYQTLIQSSLEKAVSQWQNSPNTNSLIATNSLVILGSPVEPLQQILNESLRAWQPHPSMPVHSLAWLTRPQDPLALSSKVQNALEQLHISTQDNFNQQTTPDKPQELVFLPRLEECFLRCIGGWQAVEQIRDAAIAKPSRFWLIGCNLWAWQYLDRVCQVSAYFGQTVTLPALSNEQLKDWLTPMATEIGLDVSKAIASQPQPELPHHFDHLANISLGISSIAAQLWLRSLQYEISSAKATQQLEGTETTPPGEIQQKRASLPRAPELSSDERYLLFSLLLHGGMSLPHLALSLGEEESIVYAQVRGLMKSEVIVQQQDQLIVQPAYYPKLRTELSNNNFSIGADH